jgi:hypothetical protein
VQMWLGPGAAHGADVSVAGSWQMGLALWSAAGPHIGVDAVPSAVYTASFRPLVGPENGPLWDDEGR